MSKRGQHLNVIIVGVNYAPEETGIAPYTTGLAEYLQHNNYSVTVLTGMPSYPYRQVYEAYNHVWRLQESVHEVDIRRRTRVVTSGRNVIGRAVEEVTFALAGFLERTLPVPDTVLGVTPALSGAFLAKRIARRFRVPYALIFQDLLGAGAHQSGIPGGKRVAQLAAKAEKWLALDARCVGIVAESYRPYLESLGIPAHRIHRIRNWSHLEEPLFDRKTIRSTMGWSNDAFVCLHAGNMGFKQGLTNIVECARRASDTDPNLLFVLMGDGSQRVQLERMAKSYGLENITFPDIQPRRLFPSILASADLLLLNQRSTVRDMAFPSKLSSYLASGRPIVAAVQLDTETAHEVARSGAGIVVPPDDPTELLAAIRTLARDSERREGMGRSGRAYAHEVYGPSRALAGLEAVILNALDQSSVDCRR